MSVVGEFLKDYGPIGAFLGAIAAFSAVAVALWQAKRSERLESARWERERKDLVRLLRLESMVARFVAGTSARIDEVLEAAETRSDFIRRAVDNEIERRQRAREQGDKRDAPGHSGRRDGPVARPPRLDHRNVAEA